MATDHDALTPAQNGEYRILDNDGEVRPDAEVPDLSDENLREMYADMAFARHFDERTISLQRQGRMGTYPPVAGHEAAQVGSVYAMDDEDWAYPTYRESVVALARDVPPSAVLRYWKGHEEGNVHLTDANIFPFNIVIGALIPHATGMGMAANYRDESRAAVCYFGDGATSQGDFHEGLNFAGVFDTPTVFFCSNNQYAISVSRERQTASATIAQKADAYGFEGVRIDGMDPLAVYDATSEALRKAKDPAEGERCPTLIEAVMYRFGAHTTADDPSVYRDDAEVERWRERDPLKRMERFLLRTGRIDEEGIDAIEVENEQRMADAVDAVEDVPDGDPDEMFDHVYAEPTDRLEAQRAYLDRLRSEYGDDALLED